MKENNEKIENVDEKIESEKVKVQIKMKDLIIMIAFFALIIGLVVFGITRLIG